MAMTVKRVNEGNETWVKNGSNVALSDAEIPFLVLNITTKKAAIAAVFAAAPATYEGLPLANVRFDGYEGEGNISCTAEYEQASTGGGGGASETDPPTESFSCGGGTKHVTTAIEQSRVYGGNDDDANKLVGWNGKHGAECEVSGVDVPTASMRQTYTQIMLVSAVTDATYKRKVAALVGKVNNAAFRGWAAGELMFEDMSYSTPTRGQTRVSVTFVFRVSPNESSASVAGHSIGSKKGFEYVWSRYKTSRDSNTHTPKSEVDSIYKSKVVEDANFSDLGIRS